MNAEKPVGLVRGTRDWLPGDYPQIADLEATLLRSFEAAGYARMRIPILEHTELHERKSGAGIVSKLYELADGHQSRACLRPELTAGIVRAYCEAPRPPALPWKVCVSGPVFRHETMRPGYDREFLQVGVERLGEGGPKADGEVILLAWEALRGLGIAHASLRIGHVGLILEMLARSGLPEAARAALVERLSEAAAEGRGVASLEAALEQLSGWLSVEAGAPPPIGSDSDPAVDRLFRTLVPDVTGRRTARDILGRLRRKWELAHSLRDVLDGLNERLHELAELRGPSPAVLSRLKAAYATLAPDSVASLTELVAGLAARGVPPDRVELDLGFGRGIGFYSRMVFELVVPSPEGPVEVCGGGRYDGLARVFGSDRDDRGVGFAFGLERLARVAPGVSEAAR